MEAGHAGGDVLVMCSPSALDASLIRYLVLWHGAFLGFTGVITHLTLCLSCSCTCAENFLSCVRAPCCFARVAASSLAYCKVCKVDAEQASASVQADEDMIKKHIKVRLL